MKELFRRLAEKSAHAVGSYWAFLIALLTIFVWALTGPYFNYSDTWQLFINTGTTIVTFLMVFLIQNTQNRETRIVALKLDELLRGVEGARTGLVQLDHMSDDDLELVRGLVAIPSLSRHEGEAVEWLVARMAERSEGATLRANLALLENNARVAAQIAVSLAQENEYP